MDNRAGFDMEAVNRTIKLNWIFRVLVVVIFLAILISNIFFIKHYVFIKLIFRIIIIYVLFYFFNKIRYLLKKTKPRKVYSESEKLEKNILYEVEKKKLFQAANLALREIKIKAPKFVFIEDSKMGAQVCWDEFHWGHSIRISLETIRRLSLDELCAVISHEFGHITNYDAETSMVIDNFCNFVIIFFLGVLSIDFCLKNILLFSVMYIFCKTLVISSVRMSEYAADAISARVYQDPQFSISALSKIIEKEGKGVVVKIFSLTFVFGLPIVFDTHPAIRRLEKLRNLTKKL